MQFDRQGLAWIAGGGGTAAYDVSNPLAPRLVHRTNEVGQSRYLQTLGADDGKTYNDFIHHNSHRLPNSSLAAPQGPLEADSDYVAITEEDQNRPTCRGGGSLQTWRITGGTLVPLAKFEAEEDPTRTTLCSAHYFDVRGGLLAQGWYEQGTRFLDVSDPADIRQVGFWIPNKNVTWGALYPPTDPTGEIVYSLDNSRGIDVLRIDRPEPGEKLPTVVAQPGNAPEGGGPGGGPGGGSDGGAASGARTNVSLRVTDNRRSVRRIQRAQYRVTVKHLAGPAARSLRVVIDVPRGLLRRRGTRLVRRLPALAPGASRTWSFKTRVPRRSRLRTVLVRARVTLADDANPRDNRAVDRTRVTRRRATRRRMSRAAADHRLAMNLALLPTVRAPRTSSGRARQLPEQRSAYGWVCRL